MQKSTSLFETIGDILRPFQVPQQDTEKKYGFSPEPELNIWQCKNCECDCAGDNTSGMCASCELATNHIDIDDSNYFSNEDRIAADNNGYELRNQYSNELR